MAAKVTEGSATDAIATAENGMVNLVTIENLTENDLRLETGPLQDNDLPPSCFVKRVSIGGEATAFTGVSSPIVDIIAKNVDKGELQYLVLMATYETFWLPRAALSPEFGTLISAFEEADRKKKGLPELRRSVSWNAWSVTASPLLVFENE
ncbi:hypothetical protein PInf_002705 [Phytophthora infestans]|nr:hypothetical protein PInf_002705 [Phytophthora infestans]